MFGLPAIYCRDLSTLLNKFVIPELMFSVLSEYVLISQIPSVFPIVIKVTKDITIAKKHTNPFRMQHI